MFKQKNLLVILISISSVLLLLVIVLFFFGESMLKINKNDHPLQKLIVGTEEMQVALEQIEAPLPGGNKILNDVVVSDLGEPVNTMAMPNEPGAPKAVNVNKADLPEMAINIDVSSDKFSPASFTVKAGQPVSLAFSSNDDKVHVITFQDSSLASLSFAVGPKQN
jgi:hypothetical protein